VSRRVAFVAVLAASLAGGAVALAPAPTELMPGVTFAKEVQFTPHGPVVVDVITVPKPGGLYTLAPVLARGSVSGDLEQVTEIERDGSPTATVAGINGDSFSSKGYPSGIVLQGGTLVHGALSGRSSIGIDAAGGLHVKRFAFVGTWKGAGQRRPLSGVNQPPRSGQVVLFTPAWGPATPYVANSNEVVLQPFPAATANADLKAPATDQKQGGGTPIPPDGAVLMAVGPPPLQAEAPAATSVTIRLILPPDWSSVADAIGGGPVLVKNGKAVFHTGEDFDPGKLAQRDARAGVGQLADGRIVLVAVDGGQPGYSAGLSTFELAQAMVRLGAVTAGALDFGSSVTSAFDGQLLNRPRTAGGRAVKEALLVQYAGVYAPPPPVAVLGRSDVAAGEQLAYKIVRPSTVTASVVGPDGTARALDSGMKQPGTYPFTWTAIDAEGTWHWQVSAVDELGRASAVDRPFSYDLTLSALSVPRSTTRKAGLTARFSLSRSAVVALQIETPHGTVLHSLPPEDEPAGPGLVRWDGSLDGETPAAPGSYVARVIATSEIGTTELSAPFTLRG
jgi:hypothetical protein